MDLPTYTNIWRIEKRLYKLYDFRLPAPLPINLIAVFTGITVPYIVLLVAIGLPLHHSLVWLYVLPPGVLTWLTTRPVIESKRLPELLESQLRYLTEPRVWCRLVPLSEKDQIAVTARVWHSRRVPRQRKQAGAVALRERGTLARRNRGPAVTTAGAAAATVAVTAAAAASTAPGSSRHRVRARARGSSAQGTTPAAAGKSRSADPRPAAETRSATGQAPLATRAPVVGKVLAPGQAPPAGQTAIGVETPATTHASAQSETPAGTRSLSNPEMPTAKPGRFRLAALRSRPAGPAPALPHAVVLEPPASPWPARPADSAPPASAATGTGSAAPRRPAPAGHRAQPTQPTPAGPAWPGQPGPTWPAQPRPAQGQPRPGHEMPSARPAQAQPRPAHEMPPARPAQAQPRPAHEMPPARPVPSLRPVAAPVPSSLPAHAAPDVLPVPPLGERSRGTGAPHIEVSHSGPSARLIPPAAEPPLPAPHEHKERPLVTAAPVDSQRPAPRPTQPAPSDPVDGPENSAGVPTSEVAAPVDAMPAAEVAAPVDAMPIAEVAAPVDAMPAAEAAQPEPEPEPEPEPKGLPPVSAVVATANRNETAEAPGTVQATADPFALSGAAATAADAPEVQDGPPPPPVVKAVPESEHQKVPSIERALSGPSRDRNLSWHGKVKIVAGATQGPGARDQEALDRARARLPLGAPKRVVMLGCTSGAGQTVTALMTGFILASLREQPVAAVDLHDGSLARYSAPAGWLEEIVGGKAPQPPAPARPDGLNPAHRDSPARLDVIASHEPLRDGDEHLLAEHLGRHYPLTMLDPGAAGLTKLLTVADQLVVVVPASVEAAGALADTRDWLDAHGFADLASHSVTLINGVSRRSMQDVAQAEAVARGRCRAIVRVPWDDMLPVGVTGPSTLRPQTRVAYTALAGVLVAGMAAAPIRKKQ